MRIRKYFGKREILDGDMFPRFYGRAWYDTDRQKHVCYPLGMNWIAGIVRNWYWKIAVGPRMKDGEVEYYRALSLARSESWQRGDEAGYERAKMEGERAYSLKVREAQDAYERGVAYGLSLTYSQVKAAMRETE